MPSDNTFSNDLEARLKQYEHKLYRFKEMFDLLTDFVYLHDHDMHFKFANKAAADYFGMSKDELVGKRLRDVDLTTEQGEYFEKVCLEVMAEGKPRLTDNLPYVRRDGTPGFLRQHDIPYTDPVTGEKLLFGLSRDITVERELERERAARMVLEREMEIAREIQRSSTPRHKPNIDGWMLDAYTQAAHYAGGDFYDWWLNSEGELVMCIGDVSGHGVGPAILAAECRAYARVMLQSQPLLTAVQKLDQLISQKTDGSRFITFAAARIDPRTRRLEYFSAGHGPTLLCGDDRMEELPSHAPPLGLGMLSQCKEMTTTEVKPKDLFFLLTDGFVEAANEAGEYFGVARFAEQVMSARENSNPNYIGELNQTLETFASSQEDDRTLILATPLG